MTRLLDSTRGRWLRALLLLLLRRRAVPGPLAAQDSSWGLSLAPEDDLALAPAERLDPKRPCLEYRLLPDESRDCEAWMASVDLAAGTPFRIAMADAELPKVVEARQPNRLLGTLIPLASVGLVTANSLIGYKRA